MSSESTTAQDQVISWSESHGSVEAKMSLWVPWIHWDYENFGLLRIQPEDSVYDISPL